VAADSRDEIHPRHLFDKHLDTLRQSVGFAGEWGMQQPIGYFLADSGAASVIDLDIIANGWTGHEDLPGCLATAKTDKSSLGFRCATAQA
jgi:hypothetical protein